jgi:hypothetical protein
MHTIAILSVCIFVLSSIVSAGASPIGSPSSKSGRQSCGSPLRKTVHKIHDKKPVLYRVVKKQLLVCVLH